MSNKVAIIGYLNTPGLTNSFDLVKKELEKDGLEVINKWMDMVDLADNPNNEDVWVRTVESISRCDYYYQMYNAMDFEATSVLVNVAQTMGKKRITLAEK